MWPMSCLAGSSVLRDTSTMNGLTARSLSGCTHAAGSPAFRLAFASDRSMAEGPFQPGESGMFVSHGRFTAFFCSVDEIV
jgi:hypothetical protein